MPIAIQPKIIPSTRSRAASDQTAVERGLKKLYSVTGCKIYRFLVRYAFHQKIQKEPIDRLDRLILDRGLNELAEKLGITSKRQKGELGDILKHMLLVNSIADFSEEI